MKTQSNQNRLISFWLVIAALSIGAFFFKAPEVQAQAVPGPLLGPVSAALTGTNSVGTLIPVTLGTNLSLAGSTLNATGGGATSQDVQTGLAPILTGAGDSVIFVSPTLPALAAGGCWEVSAQMSSNQNATITAVKLWYGTAPGTTGDAASASISKNPAVIIATGTVCNKNGSQTTQDILMGLIYETQATNVPVTGLGAGTQTASGTNLKIGLTIAGVNVIRPDKWTVKLVQ